MSTKDLPIIITIKHGRTAGLTTCGIYVDTEDENIPKFIREADTLCFDVKKAKYQNLNGTYAVTFICDIDQSDFHANLVYTVSKQDYALANANLRNDKLIGSSKNATRCIMTIKRIIENYDPYVQIYDDEAEEDFN